MLTNKLLSFVQMIATALLGCAPTALVETSYDTTDMATLADQQPSEPPCPAAKGIDGTVLLYADFSKI